MCGLLLGVAPVAKAEMTQQDLLNEITRLTKIVELIKKIEELKAQLAVLIAQESQVIAQAMPQPTATQENQTAQPIQQNTNLTSLTFASLANGYEFTATGEDFVVSEIIFTKSEKFSTLSYSQNNGSVHLIGSFINTCSMLKEQLSNANEDLKSRRYPSNCDNYPNAIGYKWENYTSPKVINGSKTLIFADPGIHSVTNTELINLISIKFIGQTTGKAVVLPQ